MYDQEVPILCALVAIVFLAGDRRTGALMAALCGVAWVIVMDRRSARGRPGRRRVAFHRRRWSSPPPEGMTTPTLPSPSIPDPPPAAEEPPPPPVVEDTCQQDWNGEFVAMHTAVGVPRYARRGPGMTLPPDGAPIVSPDLHVLNRERLPAVVAQGRNRRARVVGIPTRSSYRSTTGGTSSFGHLR